MAWTTPRTYTAGELVTAAILNGDVRDNLSSLRNSLFDTAVSTVTGTQNDYALAAEGVSVLRWNGASPVTFSGFTNGIAGRSVIVINITASQSLKVTHDDGNSTIGNRVICTSTAGQIIGPNGSLLLWYDGTSSRWRLHVLNPGGPLTPAFSAGDFTANGSMTWTVASGDVTTYAYQQDGKRVTFWLYLDNTTVGGTPNTDLQISLQGFTASKLVANSVRIRDNGTFATGVAYSAASGTVIGVRRVDNTNWSTSTDTTDVHGQITVEVN